MGCDIHAIIERRKVYPLLGDAYAVWVNSGDPGIDRDYALFGVLAGVRAVEYEPISNKRGLPDDCCEEFVELARAWARDAHNHGWVTLQELVDYPPDKGEPISGTLRELIFLLGRVANAYGAEHDAIRLVFFFDN